MQEIARNIEDAIGIWMNRGEIPLPPGAKGLPVIRTVKVPPEIVPWSGFKGAISVKISWIDCNCSILCRVAWTAEPVRFRLVSAMNVKNSTRIDVSAAGEVTQAEMEQERETNRQWQKRHYELYSEGIGLADL